MKVKDLKKMLEKYDDEVELVFVSQEQDRDGFPLDVLQSFYKVLDKAKCHEVKKEYGIIRYEDD